jgi:hypothetical protein
MLDFKKIVYDLKEKMDRLYQPSHHTDTEPTQAPTNSRNQRVLYKNGTTYREYVFMDGEWYYKDLTKS